MSEDLSVRQCAELVTENAELRKRRDELLFEINRLIEERRALVGLSHSEIYDLARVAYDAWRRANGYGSSAEIWNAEGDAERSVWLSTACAVVVAVRATVRAQERQAIIKLLGGGDDEREV